MAHFLNFKQDYFGLTEEEVAHRMDMYGSNVLDKEMEKPEHFSPVKMLLSPSFLLMLIAGILSLFSSYIGTGIAILLIDVFYIIAEIYTCMGADERLQQLTESSSVQFRVIRGGKLEFVHKEDIVPEDTMIVQAGEQIPADAYILECRQVTVDEGIFTRSYKPVTKYTGALGKGALKQTHVYSGSKMLTGVAICKVTATGEDTEYFRRNIHELTGSRRYYTQLESNMRRMVPVCSAIAAVVALVSMLVWIFSGQPTFTSVLNGITLGLCLVPTGVSTIIRIYYSNGIEGLVNKNILVKSLPDVEKLNSMSVFCIEKEGSISQSYFEVRSINTANEELLYKAAVLACNPEEPANAIEKAIMVRATFYDADIAQFYENTLVERIYDKEELGITGCQWDFGGSLLSCIKGAPEQIVMLCKLSGDERRAILSTCSEYYNKGYHVVAIACANTTADCDITAGFSYTYVGLIILEAPMLDSAVAAINTCKRVGVKVIMLTEDDVPVAESVGKLIGLSGKTVTGKMISDAVKNERPIDLDADIYAKISPVQKLYIIKCLQESGEIVGMTGMRVTDADALSAADVGITIADSEPAAQENADIIMKKNNISSIAGMIARARQMHCNIKRSFAIMLSGYVAMLLVTIVNIFGGVQPMMNPSLLALMTMLVLPAAALIYLGDRSDAGSELPPSSYVARKKLNFWFIGKILLTGVIIGGISLASYLFMYNGSNTDFARSCAFVTMNVALAGFAVLNAADKKPVKAVLSMGVVTWVILAAMVVLPIVLIYVPFVNDCFALDAVDFMALMFSIAPGVVAVGGFALGRMMIRFK